jgi:hypothetical protein
VSPVRLTLELDAGNPITGWIEPVDSAREPFEGLLELIVALDRLRSIEPPAPTEDAPRCR